MNKFRMHHSASYASDSCITLASYVMQAVLVIEHIPANMVTNQIKISIGTVKFAVMHDGITLNGRNISLRNHARLVLSQDNVFKGFWLLNTPVRRV